MRLITEGKLQPGQRLPNERDLARSLAVARPTVREALNALQMMNIVRIRHGEPTQVADLSPESLVEPFELMSAVGTISSESVREVRASLESGVARLAALRITPEEVAHLERLEAEVKAAVDDPSAFLEADIRLHSAILEAARNPLFSSLMAAVGRLSLSSRMRTVQSRAVREGTFKEHRDLIAALAAGDGEGAGDAMLRHLYGVARRYEGDGQRQGK